MNYIWDIETGYSTKSGLYKTKIEWDFIIKNIRKKCKNLKILDVGGGSGRFALPLSIENNVTVLDPNKEALEILLSRNNNINIINKKFENFKTNKKYDLILLIEVMQYFEDIEKILFRVNEFLNDRGICIFTNLNNISWKYIFRNILHHTDYPGTLNYFQHIELINNSFELIDVKGFNWLPLRVNSNNILTELFIKIEKIFKLNKILFQSPELLFCIRKKESYENQKHYL